MKKGYVPFESDKIGYMSYNYIDNADKDISSLELFHKDVYGSVSNYLAQKTDLSSGKDLKFDFKSDRRLKSIFAVELFDM